MYHREGLLTKNTANKGIQGMPRRLVPTKDVVHDETLRRGVCTRDKPEVSEWGNPLWGMPEHGVMNL